MFPEFSGNRRKYGNENKERPKDQDPRIQELG
jgi:hypothetical protein